MCHDSADSRPYSALFQLLNDTRFRDERVLHETSQAFRYQAPTYGIHGPRTPTAAPGKRERSRYPSSPIAPFLLRIVSSSIFFLRKIPRSHPWTRKREALGNLSHLGLARRAVAKSPMRMTVFTGSPRGRGRDWTAAPHPIGLVTRRVVAARPSSTYIDPPRHLGRVPTLNVYEKNPSLAHTPRTT